MEDSRSILVGEIGNMPSISSSPHRTVLIEFSCLSFPMIQLSLLLREIFNPISPMVVLHFSSIHLSMSGSEVKRPIQANDRTRSGDLKRAPAHFMEVFIKIARCRPVDILILGPQCQVILELPSKLAHTRANHDSFKFSFEAWRFPPTRPGRTCAFARIPSLLLAESISYTSLKEVQSMCLMSVGVVLVTTRRRPSKNLT